MKIHLTNLKKSLRIAVILCMTVFSYQNMTIAATENIVSKLFLTLTGNGFYDQAFVVFIPDATTGFDPQYDAYKLMGSYDAPQLYSIISCCNLSINALPEINNNMTVQLGFRVGANTNYTMQADSLFTFGNDTSIVIEDTKENMFYSLKTQSSFTFFGETTDMAERFKIHFFTGMNYDLKVLLSGPFMGLEMSTTLNSSGLIPLNQPFNATPWNYSETESVSSIPNPDITGWVLVEIRDAATASGANAGTVIERKACFLLKNGAVVDVDGMSYPEFTVVPTQNVFVVIYQRNHLSIMSALPVPRIGAFYTWDFTTAVDQAYGIGAQKEVATGVYAMYSGDGNADGVVNNTDKISIWQLIVGKKGYEAADYNLNGQIDNVDKNDYWLPYSGQFSQVP